MLTPSAKDPKRAEELARKKQDPDSFGPARLRPKDPDQAAKQQQDRVKAQRAKS